MPIFQIMISSLAIAYETLDLYLRTPQPFSTCLQCIVMKFDKQIKIIMLLFKQREKKKESDTKNRQFSE